MKKTFCLLILILTSTLNSCGYYKDEKLTIVNNSNINTWYQVMIKHKNENSYLHVGIGRKLKALEQDNPIVKRYIIEEMDEFSNDKILYIIFYNDKDVEYVHKNLEHLIDSEKYNVIKYSKKELDSLNWVVKYNGQQKN